MIEKIKTVLITLCICVIIFVLFTFYAFGRYDTDNTGRISELEGDIESLSIRNAELERGLEELDATNKQLERDKQRLDAELAAITETSGNIAEREQGFTNANEQFLEWIRGVEERNKEAGESK